MHLDLTCAEIARARLLNQPTPPHSIRKAETPAEMVARLVRELRRLARDIEKLAGAGSSS